MNAADYNGRWTLDANATRDNSFNLIKSAKSAKSANSANSFNLIHFLQRLQIRIKLKKYA